MALDDVYIFIYHYSYMLIKVNCEVSTFFLKFFFLLTLSCILGMSDRKIRYIYIYIYVYKDKRIKGLKKIMYLSLLNLVPFAFDLKKKKKEDV